MATSCFSEICCEDEVTVCFKEICEKSTQINDSIMAMAIIENDVFPEVGETVTIDGTPVVITACNRAETLLAWVKQKQKECSGGGKYYHFLGGNIIDKGTRGTSTFVVDDQVGFHKAKNFQHSTIESTIELGTMFMANIDALNGLVKRGSELSIIYFLKQGAIIVNGGGVNTTNISGGGYSITGEGNKFTRGSITLSEMNEDPFAPFYKAQNVSKFFKDLKEASKFTFEDYVTTGLTPSVCGNKGTCKTYDAVFGTAFTLTPDVDIASCSVFKLHQDCDKPLTLTGIAYDDTTGVITADTTVPKGKYKFTQTVTNDCCVSGATCFIVDVK